MAINVQWQPDATIVGSAANAVGYAEWVRQQQALAQQQEEASALNELRMLQFAEQQSQNRFNQQLARDQMAMGAEKFNAELADRERSRQLDMAARGMSIQGGLADQQMRLGAQQQLAYDRNIAGLLERQMIEQGDLTDLGYQQQQIGQRQQSKLEADIQRQSAEQAARERQADVLALRKVWHRLDPAQQQEALVGFQQKWDEGNLPPELQVMAESPQEQDPYDPETVVQRVQAGGLPLVRDPESGAIEWQRGFPYQMTQPWQQQQATEDQRKFDYEQQQADADAQRKAQAELFAAQSGVVSDRINGYQKALMQSQQSAAQIFQNKVDGSLNRAGYDEFLQQEQERLRSMYGIPEIGADGLPIVTNQRELETIPSGAMFRDANGNKRVKK